MRFSGRLRQLLKLNTKKAESGIALLEVLVAVGLLGIVAVVFLSGVATTTKANVINDEQATAESLARTQMDYIKGLTYVPQATTYTPKAIPTGGDFDNYTASIVAQPLNSPDDGIQKIIVTISRYSKQLFILQDYKVNR